MFKLNPKTDIKIEYLTIAFFLTVGLGCFVRDTFAQVTSPSALVIFDQEDDGETQDLSNDPVVYKGEKTNFYADYTYAGEKIRTKLWETGAKWQKTSTVRFIDWHKDGKKDEVIVGVVDGGYNGRVLTYNKKGELIADTGPIGSNIYSITVGDANGDGYENEFVTGGNGVSQNYVYNEQGRLAQFTTPAPATVTAMADLNHNGKKDQFIIGGNGFLSVFDISGVKLWEKQQNGEVYEIAIGDYDHDGDLDDVAVADYAGPVKIYDNSGTLLWTSPETVSLSVEFGDLDGDTQRDDIVVGTAAGVAAYINGNNTSYWSYNIASHNRETVLADINNDGQEEILATGRYALNVYSRAGIKLWGKSGYFGDWPNSIRVADINNDGNKEILVISTYDTYLYVLSNTGNELFRYPMSYPYSYIYYGKSINMDISDIDNDGMLNIAMVNVAGNVQVIQDVGVAIEFSDQAKANMVYDPVLGLWVYTRSFSQPGQVYTWKVSGRRGLIITDTKTSDIKIDQNVPPVITSLAVNLGKDFTLDTDDLNCVFSVADPDSLNIKATIKWYKDGALIKTSEQQINKDENIISTILAGETQARELWECRVVANDSLTDSTLICDNVFIYAAVPKHPRIFLDADKLSELRLAKENNTQLWQNLYKRVDGAGEGGIIANALAYAVTGDNFYSGKAILAMQARMSQYPTYSDGYSVNGVISDFLLGFDWVYPAFTKSERLDFVNYIIKIMDKTGTTGEFSGYGGYGNRQSEYFRAEGVAALLVGEEAKSSDRLVASAAKRAALLTEGMVKHSAVGGAAHEGEWYGSGAIGDMIYYAAAIRTAIDAAIFESTPAYQERLKYILHAYINTPGGLRAIRFGDHDNRKLWSPETQRQVLILSDHFRDLGQYGMSFLNDSELNIKNPQSDTDAAFFFLWGTNSIAAKPLDTLSKVHYDPCMGISLSRSGFGLNSTLLMFKAGNDSFSNHEHLDAASFQLISHGEELAIDSGSYDGGDYMDPGSTWDHLAQYSRRTVAHNSVLIDDDSEDSDNNYWDGDGRGANPAWYCLYGEGKPYSNDGGQRDFSASSQGKIPVDYNGYLQNKKIFQVADTFRRENNDDYAYVAANATNAYQSYGTGRRALYGFNKDYSKINLFTRELVHLLPQNDENDLVVVFDKIKVNDPAFAVKWLLHTHNDITFMDGSAALREGNAASGISESLDSTLVSTVKGQAKLFSKTLLPENPLIRKIGGGWGPNGYAYYSAGRNWPLWDYGPDGTGYGRRGDYGAWRIEVSAVTAGLERYFLHVLEPTNAASANMVAAQKVDSDSGNLVGVQTPNRVTMFAKEDISSTGGLNQPSRYTVPAEGLCKHLIVGLAANTDFIVEGRNKDTYETIPVQTISSSANGTLSFTIEMTGNSEITITPQGSAPPVSYGDVSGDGKISMYDAALTAQHAIGLITLTSEQLQKADVSGDGKVSMYDAALIAQRALGLIAKFPVE